MKSIEGRKFLAVIPARGGSKRLKRKNLRTDLGGKPLIAWTIEAALGSELIDRIVVTTDDEEIADAARASLGDLRHHRVLIRPPELARDDTPSAPVVYHAFEECAVGHELVVLLQPTSPLRNSDDIDRALENFRAHCFAGEMRALVSVSPYMGRIPSDTGLLRWYDETRTDSLQKYGDGIAPSTFSALTQLNGAIYCLSVEALKAWNQYPLEGIPGESMGYNMPEARSVDIDTEQDMREATRILARTTKLRNRKRGLDAWKDGVS